jgi:serine/threonine protein kinase
LLKGTRSQDITSGVQKDPQYPDPIGEGAGGNVYRGTYCWEDTTTGTPRTQTLNVRARAGSSCLIMTNCINTDRHQSSPRDKGRTGTNRTGMFIISRPLVEKLLTSWANKQRLNREIAIWRSLNHPNVAELLGTAQLNPELPPGLVSRWVQRSDFLKYIGRHPELKRKKVSIIAHRGWVFSIPFSKAREIALGLQYLHELDVFDDDDGHKGIVHGDLKVVSVCTVPAPCNI